MARDRDRDDDRFDDDRDPPRRGNLAAARSKVTLPAILLILVGLAGVAVEGVSLAGAIAAPQAFGQAYADAFKPIIESQPPSKQRDDQLAQIEQVRQMRLDTPLSLASVIVGGLASALILVGGLRMKALKGWGLAVTGSVLTFYPLGGCLCCGAPLGLWALIVLMNADVKAAFAAGRTPPTLTTDGE